ncbi:MAG: PLP-dependent aspartate aminotransferase family protein [Trichocoleus desertorum ATA4-8-CV12]|jgi:cystathionine beta-lyase|nr:PLP-dependent aspartate aminotransferase family protein [Trichocoleus desertorum ATA4-8-CV12]
MKSDHKYSGQSFDHVDTSLAHLGRQSAKMTNSVNAPLVRASTTIFPSLSEFKNSYRGLVFESPRYGRSGTQTNFELQHAMATLCNAETCIATGSGLSAIAAVLGAHARLGGHILVQESAYGPTQAYCKNVLEPFDCQVETFESSESLEQKIKPQTSLIFIEVPSSLTMRVIDVASVCRVASIHGIPVACDSTWGTPIFFDAHALGIDISIHAATKYINGHSDVLLGLITGSYDALRSTRSWCDTSGVHAAPDSCWLALRGMRTLALRMNKHHNSAIQVATWLEKHPHIRKVFFPALPSNEGHALWIKQFSGAPGPFTVELQPCSERAFETFMDSLRLFGIGTSWGGFESLVMPAIAHNLRGQHIQPDDGRLVRFHIGLEDPNDLCVDISNALNALSAQH